MPAARTDALARCTMAVRVAMRRGARRLATAVAVLVAVAALASPAAAHGADGPPEPDIAGIDEFLAAELEVASIPGAAMALTRGDQVLQVRGYGHDSTGAPVTGDTMFRIASLSKSFTALAVMQLVEAGLISLDDPIQEHLLEFQLADPRAADITVRQLLGHTSGLTDAEVPELSRPQPTTLREAATSLRSARLASPPGTRWSYHNPNYHVAARLVEVISGESFDTYLRRHILTPLGMASTTSTVTDDQEVPGLAEGHVVAYGQAIPAPGLGSFSAGDGGLVSTAADMARWLVLHAGDGGTADGTRIVSSQGLTELHSPSAPGVGYALGWDTHGARGTATRLEHSGNVLTFSAHQAIWPESGYGVVLLFNSGSGLMLDQTAIVHGVLDLVGGAAPTESVGGIRLTAILDAALALFTLATLFLGVQGVLSARRWARRHRRTPLRLVVRLLPFLVPVGVGAAFPALVESVMGRDVTWRAVAYGWPALAVFACAALAAALVILLARSMVAVRECRGHAAPELSRP